MDSATASGSPPPTRATRLGTVGRNVGRTTPDVPAVAYYLHTDQDTRRRAEEAGYDLVVPRSRMNREAAALVERLLAR